MKKSNFQIFLTTVILIICWQNSYGQQRGVEQEIIRITEEYNQAWRSLNVDSISKYHAEDILYYWHGSKGPTSKTEFENFLKQILPTMTVYQHRILDIQVQVLSDNVVVASHTYDGEFTGIDGKSNNYDGALTYVFHKISGQWKIVLIHESARN